MNMSSFAMRSPRSTLLSACTRSFAKFESEMCARSTNFSTKLACESLKVRLTKLINSQEQVIFTSSWI
jgi:hypothetical protein